MCKMSEVKFAVCTLTRFVFTPDGAEFEGHCCCLNTLSIRLLALSTAGLSWMTNICVWWLLSRGPVLLKLRLGNSFGQCCRGPAVAGLIHGQ